MCLVDALERSKVVQYPATLLASGPKKDMDLEMACLINQNVSSDEREQEPELPRMKHRTVSKTSVTNAALLIPSSCSDCFNFTGTSRQEQG